MSIQKKVIQVGGTVRSGTTMVGLVLANSENAISLGEIMHLFTPYRQRHFEKISELRKDPVWNKIINDSPENLYRNVFEYFPHIDLIIDSSKDPLWFKKCIKNIDSEILQLVTYKSPQALRNSFLKRKMNNWEKVYMNYYRRFFTIFPMAPSVSLANLLNEADYLEKLCQHLEIPYFDSRINYWDKRQPNFFGSETVKQKKIDPTILKKDKEVTAQDSSRLENLYTSLEKKQFINKFIDIKYSYPSFSFEAASL